jgi:hypothetical protein
MYPKVMLSLRVGDNDVAIHPSIAVGDEFPGCGWFKSIARVEALWSKCDD